MKVRNGFVSNSSSSSFLIYGVSLEMSAEELKELLEKNDVELDEDTDDIYELVEELDSILGKDFEYHMPEYYDTIYIGVSWDGVGDDETGKQFQERVEGKLKEILKKDVKCSTHAEAWRDG